MRRVLAIAATFALAVPTLAVAQPAPGGHKGPPAKPAPHGPAPHGPVGHGPAFRGPVVRAPVVHGPVHVEREHRDIRVGGPGPRVAPFVFHGRPFAWHPVRYPRPWVYPPGYGYRLWAVGAILPPLFWAANSPYFYTDWATMGLPPPDPGFQYVEYGPDLLLVNVATGEVVQVFPGAFS